MQNLSTGQQQWRAKYGAWAVVTGASDGVGREMARSLAREGLNLVLVARRQNLLETLAAELTTSHGIQTKVLGADLSQDEAVLEVISATGDLNVGLLIANAGFGTAGRFIDATLDQELNMIDVNCKAVLTLSHAFGRRFAQQRRGGIVLMSSLSAFQGVPLTANYAATKAYVQSLAEALHIELSPFGVDVLASAPGPIHSGFASRANMHMSAALTPEVVSQSTLKALGHRSTVRPGWLSILLETSLSFLPRWARVRLMGQVMRTMTKA